MERVDVAIIFAVGGASRISRLKRTHRILMRPCGVWHVTIGLQPAYNHSSLELISKSQSKLAFQSNAELSLWTVHPSEFLQDRAQPYMPHVDVLYHS